METKNSIIAWAAMISASVIISPFIMGGINYYQEAAKYGWSELYGKVLENQAKQVKASLGQTVEEPTTQDEVNTETPTDTQVESLVLTEDEIKKVYQDRPVLGKEWAKITFVENSDFQCHYCQRQHNDKTYESVKADYSDDELNFLYRPYPTFDKPGAAVSDCLAFSENPKNKSIYYDVISKIYETKKSGESDILGYVKDLGGDVESLKECIADNNYEETQQAAVYYVYEKFDIKGTPGNILINNETGEYKVISGAVQPYVFKQAIDELLGK